MKKTLKNALITVLLLSGALINCLHAQTDKPAPTKVPDMLQNADYVFEGTVVDSKGFPVTLELSNGVTKKTIFTSLLVQVETVFKGVGMKQGLVQILVEGGSIPSETRPNQVDEVPFYLEDDVQIPKFNKIGQKGIVAGKIVGVDKGIKWNKILENTMILDQTEAIVFCEECGSRRFFAPWAGNFENAKDLRQSIKSFNLKTDFIDRNDIVEDSLQKIQDSIAIKEKIKLDADYQIRLKEYELHQQKLKASPPINETGVKKNAITNENLRINNDIFVESRNFTYSTNLSNQKFIDFDVFVWSTQPKYLNDLLVIYNYDKFVFGNAVASSGNATATLGTSYNSINYKIYGGAVDANDSSVALSFGANDSLVRPNRIALSSTPTQLMHLKLKIQNCVSSTKMAFYDKFVMELETDYVLNANDSVYAHKYFFDTAYYNDYSPIALCPMPKITGFSPSVIRAGTNEVLTITGSGFGGARGKGQVLFPDADSIGRYLEGCDTLDYISWTNTEIKVKVPSTLLNSNYSLNQTAGSGKFKVKNNLDFRDSVSTKLDIQYSLINAKTSTDSIKKRVNLIYGDCANSARTFKLHSSLETYPLAAIMIDSAINTWARFLNIDLRILKDNYNGYIFPSHTVNNQDTVNSIYVNNSMSALMRTTPYRGFFCASNNQRYISGADIEINMNYAWHFGWNNTKPINTSDFFEAILHELGHALGLDHTINPNTTDYMTEQLDLMSYSQTSNVVKTASQRATLETGRQMAKAASLNIRDTSKLINWICADSKKIREFSSPSNKIGCVGSAVSFTAYCEQPSGSSAPSYTWQHFNATSNQWVNTTTASLLTAVSGQLSGTLTITSAPATLNGKSFRCKIANVDGCTLYTQVAVLSFNTPSFYTNPTNKTVNEHSSFNLPAQSGDSTLQYKWQQKLSGSSVYNDINDGGYFSGTTTQTLSISNTPITPISFDQCYFRCKGTNTAGCIGYSSAAKITVNPTGFAPTNPTNNSISESKLKIYPNPSSNLITVAIDNKNNDLQSLSILNSAGKEVYKYSFKGSSVDIDISSFPTGLYMVQLNNGISVQNKEFVITR